MFYDRRFEAALESAAEAEQAAQTAASTLGDMGEEGGTGAVGMEPELGAPTGEGEGLEGLEDLGGEAGAEAEAAPAPEPEEGDLLAAPPGRRDDGGRQVKKEGGKTLTTTPKSKSWYAPRSNFAGGDRRKVDGPLQKQMTRAASPEVGTKRKNFPGSQELASLVRGSVLSESKLTIYSKEEENKILKDQEELKVLFENLELELRKEKNETEA
jgi:hypothetical protein